MPARFRFGFVPFLLGLFLVCGRSHGQDAYPRIREIRFDPSGSLWVTSQAKGSSLKTCLARWDGRSFAVIHEGYMHQGLSFSGAGDPLSGSMVALNWKGAHQHIRPFSRACYLTMAWIAADQVWIGTNHGAVRASVAADGTLAGREESGLGIFPADSLPHLAAAGGRLWGGNPGGLAHRSLDGDGNWSVISATVLGGAVSGLRAGTGSSLWIGLDGPRLKTGDYWWQGSFSGKGLRRHDGKALTSWTAADSELPGDTLEAVFPLGDDDLLLACRRGIFRFNASGRAFRVAPPVEGGAFSLAMDRGGNLFAGSDAGFFRLTAEGPVFLGYPGYEPTAVRSARPRAQKLPGRFQHSRRGFDAAGRRRP